MSDSDKPLLAQVSNDKQRLVTAIAAAVRGERLVDDNCLPAIVIAFDRANNVATVRPLIQWVDVNDGVHRRHPLAGLNVFSLGGGGFHISFPLREGDLGWIIASDRDLSLFKQSLSETKPNTGRIHKFEDGWFVPDVFRKYTINGEDTDAMVIQSVDSETRISISDGKVIITAPTSTKVVSPLTTFTGDVVINQNLQVDQAAAVAGFTNVNGGFAAADGQACTLPATTTVDGVNVDSHGHTSNSPGNRTIGGMIA